MFVDAETISMVHQNEEYDDSNTSNTRRVDETSFTEPAITEATSTLRLTQKVKQDKLAAMTIKRNRQPSLNQPGSI